MCSRPPRPPARFWFLRARRCDGENEPALSLQVCRTASSGTTRTPTTLSCCGRTATRSSSAPGTSSTTSASTASSRTGSRWETGKEGGRKLGLSSNPFFKIQITHESFPKSTKSAAIQNQFLREGICSKSLPNPDRILSQFSHIFW